MRRTRRPTEAAAAGGHREARPSPQSAGDQRTREPARHESRQRLHSRTVTTSSPVVLCPGWLLTPPGLQKPSDDGAGLQARPHSSPIADPLGRHVSAATGPPLRASGPGENSLGVSAPRAGAFIEPYPSVVPAADDVRVLTSPPDELPRAGVDKVMIACVDPVVA